MNDTDTVIFPIKMRRIEKKKLNIYCKDVRDMKMGTLTKQLLTEETGIIFIDNRGRKVTE